MTATPGAAEPRQAFVSIDDLEAAARDLLPQLAYDYIAGGAGDEWTLAENRRAFGRWVIRPRVMVDVSNVDTATTVLGEPVSMPVLVAPAAFHRMAHSEGESATARGAAEAGTILAVSTVASVSLEAVAGVAPQSPRWFQLYIHRDRELTAGLVRRAGDAGYRALLVTVDAPVLGRRLRDERNRFALPPGVGLANLMGMELPEVDGSGLFAYFNSELDASVTWDDVAWLRSISPLPLLVKGVLTAEDAELAAASGVEGIVVSNHGGRQLDGAPASLDVLPEVVEAVAGRAEVLMDGGVRRGTDILKAIALGARAVLVGRPVLWGLAVGGAEGVRTVLEALRDELALAMALAGRPSIVSIDRSAVMRAPG